MQSSSAARAWPHFVPRMELEAELQVMNERIDAACKRLDKAEAQDARLRARLDEQAGEQRDDVGARLAENEQRVAQEVAGLRLELQRGLEDARANTAAEAAVRERMLTAVQSQYEELGRDLAALDRNVVHLDTAVRAVPTLFATKAEAAEVQEKALSHGAELFGELREELARIELAKPSHQNVRDLHDALQSKHDDLHLNSTLASNSIDGLKNAVEQLEKRQGDVEGSKVHVEVLASSIADLGRQLRSAREEQKTLRSQVSTEHEALRRTVFGFQDSARELRGAMELLGELEKARLELGDRCEKHERDLESLAIQEKSHWEASQGALQAHKEEHNALEALCKTLQQDLGKHVQRTKEKTDQLSKHSVSLCFEQMDKAIGLHKSLAEIERGHRELQEQVKSVHLPKV